MYEPMAGSLTESDPTRDRVIRGLRPRAKELLGLPEKWDGYRAPRIDSQTVATMLAALAETMPINAPLPTLIPTPQGGVQAEWHEGGFDIELEINPGEPIEFWYRDLRLAEEGEFIISHDLEPLRTVFARLATRTTTQP
jgi:hypothetical protein